MNTMNIPLYIIDAFAEQAYSGNPAAVCLLEHPVDEGYMQKTAAEMNLSETAFLWTEEDGYRLRWFTPKVEVKLCGHGTLASAHVLWESGLLAPDMEARFYTRSGLLRASRSGDLISLYFPPYQLQPSPVISGLAAALGIAEANVVETMRYADNVLVRLDQEARVRELSPDFGALSGLEGRGFAVTAESSIEGIDCISRFFAPKVGVNEDPVTGSAHTALAPFWADRLNRTQLTAYQASKRGGLLQLEVSKDEIKMSGRALTIVSGELHVKPC
ncbi:PhzF family phenazine biosynthesis protein [Paenibacillus odorifer]|uniref:PhzF family phenazine biosynthesis protein n=1 Tax=Paenibacillus odorifer TaxID=189426 RepID=UPI0020C9706D|nr:PhzF family phenazine biosynthesis protein [Paenibacillus odorifer]